MLMDVETDVAHVAVHELVKLTDGVKPDVLEAALAVGCRIGRAARGETDFSNTLSAGRQQRTKPTLEE